jgi:hypothetical protein
VTSVKKIFKKGKDGKTYAVNIPVNSDNFYWTVDPASSAGGSFGGSFSFGGVNQFLSIAGNTDFVLGTGSFTVEWYQYATSLPVNSRVFTQVVWPTAEFGVSIENYSGQVSEFLWLDGLGNTPAVANSASVTLPYLNTWHHFAIARSSGSYLQMFQDGVAIKTITDTSNVYITANISSSSPIIIGGEGDNAVTTRFSGSITNFRLVKGYALYSQSYSVSRTPLTAVAGTVLLLTSDNIGSYLVDSSGLNKTVTGNSVSWSIASPFV